MAYALEVDWDGDGDFDDPYEDVTGDLLLKPHSWSLGFAKVYDRIASQGRMSFVLRNDADNVNEEAGLYTPENTAGSLYGNLLPRRDVKLSYGATELWRGQIEDIRPDAQGVFCTIECVDRVARMIETEVDIALQTNQTMPQLFVTLLGEVFETPVYSIAGHAAPQMTQYGRVGDNWLSEEMIIHQAMREIAEAEHARIWIDEEGMAWLTTNLWDYENARSVGPVGTLDADHPAVKVVTDYDVEFVRNRIVIEVQPRTASASDVVLWESDWAYPKRIKGDDTETWHVKFRDAEGGARLGAENLIEPVKGVDVNASYLAGAGPEADDANGDFSVFSFEEKANGATVVIKNTGNRTIYLTYLRVRGDALYTYDKTVITAEDTTSQDKYSNGKPKTLERRFKIPIPERRAQYLAEELLRIYKDPVTHVRVRVMPRDDTLAALIREARVMNLIALEDQGQAPDGDYRIIKAEHDFDDDVHSVWWTLERHVDPGFWLWDESQWDVSTRWGPAL